MCQRDWTTSIYIASSKYIFFEWGEMPLESFSPQEYVVISIWIADVFGSFKRASWHDWKICFRISFRMAALPSYRFASESASEWLLPNSCFQIDLLPNGFVLIFSMLSASSLHNQFGMQSIPILLLHIFIKFRICLFKSNNSEFITIRPDSITELVVLQQVASFSPES